MEGIELAPSVYHCIETIAREEFWNSENRYVKSGCKDKRLEEGIKLLKSFLESMNFKKFRSQS
jgi:hypothetical protein